MTVAVQQLRFTKDWVGDIAPTNTSKTAYLYVNNTPAISMVYSLNDTKRGKCIDVRHYYVQDTIRQSHIAITRIPTQKQKGDILTKLLKLVCFLSRKTALGINPPPSGYGSTGACDSSPEDAAVSPVKL